MVNILTVNSYTYEDTVTIANDRPGRGRSVTGPTTLGIGWRDLMDSDTANLIQTLRIVE
jgi:hypothetical protein